MIGEAIAGVMKGIAEAVLLWSQGREAEAKAALDAACRGALDVMAQTAKAHADRDAATDEAIAAAEVTKR